jgi:hypothetical protein
MHRVAMALVLCLVAPGLLVPGGIELRMCFCTGLAGPCCHESPEPPSTCGRCCDARESQRRAARGPLAKAESRCEGCVKLALPERDAVRAAPPAPSLAVPVDAPATVELLIPVLAPLSDQPPTAWHPPPPKRCLPLVI